MKALLVILCVFGLATMAKMVVAAEATSTLSWQAPETRVDGSALLPEDIAEYRVVYTVDGQPASDNAYISIGPGQTSEAVTLNLQPRANDYVVSFSITVLDTEGRESEPSETVSKVFSISSTSEPSAPNSIDFTITCGAGCTIQAVTGN